jgi:hypothetical protein
MDSALGMCACDNFAQASHAYCHTIPQSGDAHRATHMFTPVSIYRMKSQHTCWISVQRAPAQR